MMSGLGEGSSPSYSRHRSRNEMLFNILPVCSNAGSSTQYIKEAANYS